MILYFILGIIIGCLLSCIIIIPKIKTTKILDYRTIEQNKQLEFQKEKLLNEIFELDNAYSRKQNEIELSTKKYYNSKKENADLVFNNYLEELRNRYAKAEEEYKEVYLETLKDGVSSYQEEIIAKQSALKILEKAIEREQSLVNAAVEANKRAAADRDKADFYRLVLSEEDKKEIMELKDLLGHFRNPEPLNKVIWKTYYEKPYTSLVGRVIGNTPKCGIYKITNINNGMCYVGQASNFADRWKQHIKRGMGADTPTQNKLYPAMLKEGVENFTFEIIEECDRASLTDREKYWTDFYKAQEFGYSVRRG